jgi:hypothetical protein
MQLEFSSSVTFGRGGFFNHWWHVGPINTHAPSLLRSICATRKMKKETKPRGNSFRRLSYRFRKKATSSDNDQQQQQQQSEDAPLLEPLSQSTMVNGMQPPPPLPWRDQEMPLQRQMMELALSSPTSRSSDPMQIVSSPCCSSAAAVTSAQDQDTLTSSPGGLTCTVTPSSSLAFFNNSGGGGGGNNNNSTTTTTTVVTGLTNGVGDTWRQSNVFAKLGRREPLQSDNDTLVNTASSSIKSVASSGSLSTTSLGITLSTADAVDRPLSTGSSSTSTPTLTRRGYSSSVGADAKPTYAAYHDGYLRPLNLDEFSHWSVPFCFICRTDCGPDYQYATSIRVTGSRFGVFQIGGTMRRDPFVYRQIYVCQPCDTVVQQNSPDTVVRLCPDAHAFFL